MAPEPPLLELLHSGRALLMDGAVGTQLLRRGLRAGENAVTWNLLQPSRVRAVHRAYRQAGAEVLLTNTFLLHADLPPAWAGERGAVWQAARRLLGRGRFYRVAALGPVAGDPTRELDDLERDLAPPEQAGRFDAVLLETCSTPRAWLALGRLRRAAPGCPLLLSLAYRRQAAGRLVSASGHEPAWFARRARKQGVDALGVNCGQDVGLEEVLHILRCYRQETDLPLFARPNAGTPRDTGGRLRYPLTPAELAARLPELLEAGACMVGGCCGTTPRHIAALRPGIEKWNRDHGFR